MGQPSPPALTVLTGSSRQTFAPGSEIVVGRDLRADVRVVHPMVSRAHLTLRFDGGRWVAFDNGSRNGIYVDRRRVPSVDVVDGQAIQLGSIEDGPVLTFEVGREAGSVGSPPQRTVEYRIPAELRQLSSPMQAPPSGPMQAPMSGPIYAPPSGPIHAPPSGPLQAPPGPRGYQPQPPRAPSPPRPPVGPPSGPQQAVGRPPTAPRSSGAQKTQLRSGGVSRGATGVRRLLGGTIRSRPVGAITIGRESDNDIVIPDVLVSRLHATLMPGPSGMEIQDERSSNGTFVNGVRIGRAYLEKGDTVTIGNVDLVFENGTLVRRAETDPTTRTGGLEVQGITFTVEGDKKLLDNISISARPGTLTAVIGPSGAGKSTFAKLVAGYTHPTAGTVAFEGHDIHAEYASLRTRIGMVPQDDVVHSQLTVNQALAYAAELRLPPDTTKADRAKVVAEVLEELEMTKHADTRVDKLSGGQRKRASVALELLTGPVLLILDEPTTGLDPALDRQVMTMLRHLADAGRVVLVVTHSLTYLDICDQVLLLAPGGKTAFFGPPGEIGAAMGTKNWADIFSAVADDPDAVHRRFLEQNGPAKPPPPAVEPSDLGSPAKSSLWRQFSTIARRQFSLILADRGYFVFLALLPFIMGALTVTAPGTAGFAVKDPNGAAGNEAPTILVMLNMGALLMGTTLTIRTLIGERAIFLREQAVGLSTNAYLLAKICVFAAVAVLQATIMVGIMMVGKGGPTQGAVLLKSPVLELWFGVALTCVAAAMVGLALSSFVKTNSQVMPILIVTVMCQLVFSGGAITITGRPVLDQLSWILPARWGYAATAATVDMWTLAPGKISPKDSHWKHEQSAWLLDIAMLFVLCFVYGAFVRWRIRLRPA
jgi:ABC-type multidrug transport system ATPase subunit